jgi:hypothetical protein
MFDLNQILSAALNAAVAEAIKPLVERMGLLEAALADRHERIAALETKLTEAALFERNINVQTLITPETVVNSMNNAEWLWEKINAYIETGIEDRMERAIDDHCETYNHDDYDNVYNEWGGESVDDFVKDGYVEEQIEEKVNETLRNASFEIRVL